MSGCRESNPVYTRLPVGGHLHPVRNLSESRESNPVYTHPKRAYYRYTTLRYFSNGAGRAYYRYTTARFAHRLQLIGEKNYRKGLLITRRIGVKKQK